jgi:methyl-accepting chemotaxis protein
MSGEEDKPTENGAMRAIRTVTPGVIRRSFALKFGLVLLVMAVSIAGIGLAATDKISSETADNVETEYRSVAEAETSIIEGWLRQNQLSTQYISRIPALRQDNSLQTRQALTDEQYELGDGAHALHLVNRTGDGTIQIVSSTAEIESGTALGDGPRAWVGQRLGGSTNLADSEVLINETYSAEGTQVVGFLSPVANADGKFLLVEMKVSNVANQLQGQERAEGGFTQVVSSDTERVVLAEDADSVGTAYADGDAALEPITSANGLREQTSEAGVIASMPANSVLDSPYAVGYAPVDGTDWVVLTHAPRSSVFGFVQTISNWGLFATIAAVLLIGVTGTALGYSTSRAIDRLTGKTEQMRDGDLNVNLATPRVDNIGRLYAGFASMRDSLQEQISEAERAREQAEVSRAEALELSNHLQSRAEEYSKVMQACAAGNLTQRMERDDENESMDRIASEFNEMIEELEKTTGQLKSYVDEVEEAGTEVEQSATTVRKASEEVAESIQKIAVDADDQKERLQTISEMMDDIARELEQSSGAETGATIDAQLNRIESVAGELNEIAQLSEETQSETDNVSAAAEEQAAELTQVSERANDLQRYAQPLRDILGRFETEAEHEFVFSVGPTGDAEVSNQDD